MVQQLINQESDLTEIELNLTSINEALVTVLEEGRTPSPDSGSSPPRGNPFPEHVSQENTPVITRRNTMSFSSGPANPTHVTLTAEQFQALLDNTRPPPVEDRPIQLKLEKPPPFSGERTRLWSFLVLCRVYYPAMGIMDNRTKITFMETLFRGPAVNWLTIFTEGKKERTWTTYGKLEEVLQKQFGDPDAEGTARNKIEKLKQGGDIVTEFWNTFRLLSTEANMDNGTLQRCFIKEISSELQEAWPRAQTRHDSVEELANLAVEQENCIVTIKQIKQSRIPPKTTEIPRGPNGTFQSRPENRKDPIELDATWK